MIYQGDVNQRKDWSTSISNLLYGRYTAALHSNCKISLLNATLRS